MRTDRRPFLQLARWAIPNPVDRKLGALYVAVLSEQNRTDVEGDFAALSNAQQDHTTPLAQVLAALVVLSPPKADKKSDKMAKRYERPLTKDVAIAIQAFNAARKQNPKLTKAKFLRDYCEQTDASVTSLARAMSDHKALYRRREKADTNADNR